MSSINPIIPNSADAARNHSRHVRESAGPQAGAGAAANGAEGVGRDVRTASRSAALRGAIEQAAGRLQGATEAADALDRVSTLLADLRALTAAKPSAEPTAGAQERIDELVATIDRVASASGFEQVQGAVGPVSYRVDDVAPQLEAVEIQRARLFAGETAVVELEVIASAAPAELLLSFGGAVLDLGAADQTFVIEIEGENGSQTLSFASGTALVSVAEAINVFTQVTGVSAELDDDRPGAISLLSEAPGGDEFVSVRIVDDGGFERSESTGLYTQPEGEGEPVFAGAFDSDAAEQGVTDEGHAAALSGRVRLDGGDPIELATTRLEDGSYRIATTTGSPYLVANVRLTDKAAATLGAFDAFVVQGPPAAAGDVDGGGRPGLIESLDAAIASRRAESQAALEDALDELGRSPGVEATQIDGPRDAQRIAAALRTRAIESPESAMAALLGSGLDSSRHG